ncbi:MAG: hypothetical protein WD431_14530 [Cyclobacteriaceae bacterium]
MDAKGEYIYGLSYENPFEETRNPDISTNSKILVFDWQGNPVKELLLSGGRFIQSFAVDGKNPGLLLIGTSNIKIRIT